MHVYAAISLSNCLTDLLDCLKKKKMLAFPTPVIAAAGSLKMKSQTPLHLFSTGKQSPIAAYPPQIWKGLALIIIK